MERFQCTEVHVTNIVMGNENINKPIKEKLPLEALICILVSVAH